MDIFIACSESSGISFPIGAFMSLDEAKDFIENEFWTKDGGMFKSYYSIEQWNGSAAIYEFYHNEHEGWIKKIPER